MKKSYSPFMFCLAALAIFTMIFCSCPPVELVGDAAAGELRKIREMVPVPGAVIAGAGSDGVFIQGCTVTLSDFEIAKYETVWTLWNEVKTWGEGKGYSIARPGNQGHQLPNPSSPNGTSRPADWSLEKRVLRPVSCISWQDIIVWLNAYTEWCNEITGSNMEPVYYMNDEIIKTNIGTSAVSAVWAQAVFWDRSKDGYRLPTEAEWEFAARGGNQTMPDWNLPYAGSDDLDSSAWHKGNANITSSGGFLPANSHRDYGVHPVGSLNPNRLGLYDMSGNVYEFVWDRTGTISTGPVTDPAGSSSGNPVSRGGAWKSTTDYAVTYRYSGLGADTAQESYHNHIGFRIARNISNSALSAVPVVAESTVQKISEVQAAVNFTLANAISGEWKVYGSGNVIFNDVTASVSGMTLTLTHSASGGGVSDLPQGSYFITVTEEEKSESRRLKLTVTPKIPFDRQAMISINGAVITGTFEGNSSTFINGRTVTLSDFKLAKYETVWSLWNEVKQWSKGKGYTYKTDTERQGNTPTGTVNGTTMPEWWTEEQRVSRPVTAMQWIDIIVWLNAYTEWCNEKNGNNLLQPVYYTNSSGSTVFKTGNTAAATTTPYWDKSKNGFRLPTEAEWEYAARGAFKNGSPTADWTLPYAGSDTLDDVAWHEGIANSIPGGNTNKDFGIHPVGTKLPNHLGLYDMTGNAQEWVWDRNGSIANGPITNPQGAGGTSDPVRRGGGWKTADQHELGVTDRLYGPSVIGVDPPSHNHIGFRIAQGVIN